MKKIKLLTKIAIISIALLAFSGCKSNELTILKAENYSLEQRVKILELKVVYLQCMDSILVKQNADILYLIERHLKYNH
jgi:hypothetical protein